MTHHDINITKMLLYFKRQLRKIKYDILKPNKFYLSLNFV